MFPHALFIETQVPSYEFSLVIFTVLSQVSIGLSMVGLMFSRALSSGATLQLNPENGQSLFVHHIQRLLCLWSTNVLIMAVALGASLFHLGHPFKAHQALTNLQGAWLSREILSFGVYFGLLLITLISLIRKKKAFGASKNSQDHKTISGPKLVYELASLLTVAVGFIALIASSLAYAPPALSAINNVLPLLFFTITTLGLGFAVGLCFLPKSSISRQVNSINSSLNPSSNTKSPHQKLYRRLACICAASLLVGFILYLIMPCVWLSGGPIMQITASQWLASPWFWGHLLLTFLWPLLILWRCAYMPCWLPIAMLIGALMGRMSFFADTVSTAILIGNPF